MRKTTKFALFKTGHHWGFSFSDKDAGSWLGPSESPHLTEKISDALFLLRGQSMTTIKSTYVYIRLSLTKYHNHTHTLWRPYLLEKKFELKPLTTLFNTSRPTIFSLESWKKYNISKAFYVAFEKHNFVLFPKLWQNWKKKHPYFLRVSTFDLLLMHYFPHF